MARPARTGIATSVGKGPKLETITRSNGVEVPLVTTIAVGDWGYRAGEQGAIILPEDGRLLSFSCMAGPTGATVSVNDGDVIPIPADLGFGMNIDADVFNAKIKFTGTVTYFVQYVKEGNV